MGSGCFLPKQNDQMRRKRKVCTVLYCGRERRDPHALDVKAVSAGAKPT